MRTGLGAVNAAMERSTPKRHARGRTKVYALFPHGGSFSVKTIDYHGTELSVAATSVRQAYALAHKGGLTCQLPGSLPGRTRWRMPRKPG